MQVKGFVKVKGSTEIKGTMHRGNFKHGGGHKICWRVTTKKVISNLRKNSAPLCKFKSWTGEGIEAGAEGRGEVSASCENNLD